MKHHANRWMYLVETEFILFINKITRRTKSANTIVQTIINIKKSILSMCSDIITW